MTAFGPARAWYSSTTSRSDCPRCWAAKGMTVVVPPNAAETVALQKSSAVMKPGGGELLDVAVAVDPAREDELAGGVDDAPAVGDRPGKVLAERRDPPVPDRDVAA